MPPGQRHYVRRRRVVHRLDGRAGGDDAVGEDVRTQAAAVDQPAQYAAGGQAFEVDARLAQALAEALHVPYAEAAPDQGVQVDAPGDQVAAGLGVGELDAAAAGKGVERLGLDQS